MSPEPEIVARIQNLVVEFDGRRAVDGVDLVIPAGQIVALVGESGSGKTVLGSCLIGLPPGGRRARVTGSVEVAGVDMLNGPRAQRHRVRRHRIGAVFQDPLTSLDPMMRVGAQVRERGASTERALAVMDECGVPEPAVRYRYWPHQLSGGLRQRVGIAGAIATEPEQAPALIVADEPTTALDVSVQAKVVALFARLRERHGCSILLITHDLGVAAQIADRIVVMSTGRVREQGPAARVLRAPEHPYTRKLLASRLDVNGPFGAADGTPGEQNAVLTLDGIVKSFGLGRREHRRVLHGVDLDLRAGESVALVGESGSGKSTLLRIAAGLERPDEGRVTCAPDARPQLIFQDARASLTPWMTIGAQLTERLALAGIPRARRAARVAELLEQVGLEPAHARVRPGRMSGGQCQRAAIARALASDPRVLLCDEPVSALDATLAAQIVDLLDNLRRSSGLALLLVTHDLAVAKRIAGRVAVMTEGRIVEQGSVREVFEHPRHEYTRTLLAASPSLEAAR